jgi:hypothetical protein
MDDLSFDWFVEPPIDIEFKKYKLLAQISRHEKSIENWELQSALNYTEFQLSNLYKFVHFKGETDEKRKVLKGIDFSSMELIYELPSDQPEIEQLVAIADFAIDKYEELYRSVRDAWREVEYRATLTYIPSRPIQLGSGIIIIPYKDKFKVYEFKYPAHFDGDWRGFDLTHVFDKNLNEDQISKILDYGRNSLGHNIFIRISRGLDLYHFNETVIPIVKQKVFLDLKKNYFF